LGQFITPLFFLIADVLWWRTAFQHLRGARHARVLRLLLSIFMAFMTSYAVLILVGPRSMRGSHGPVPQIVHVMAYLWHLVGLPIAGVIAILHSIPQFIRFLRKMTALFGEEARAILRSAPQTSASAVSPVVPKPSRRQVMAAAVAIAPPLAIGAASLGAMTTLYGRRLRSFDLMIPQLPPQLHGMRIAHVSDTHIGKFLHPSRLPAIAEDINKLDADFVVFTGDLIDFSLEDLPAGIDFLRGLKSRCGIAICEGNHDIMDDRGEFENQIRAAGLPIIIGNQLALPYVSPAGQSFPVQFLATPWNFTDEGIDDAVHFIEPLVRQDAFPILLAHHPHHFDAASKIAIPLVLSGHTHGGQIMLNDHFGVGNLRFRYISGHYQRNGSNLIVNNGLGNWFPLRINAPAEIVHITLHGMARPYS
jgi:predicted MPP superfamily phosphohydrolase